MSTHDPVAEFRSAWLPHATDDGLNRIIELLEKASPLLIHGMFTRAVPMGCLASHRGIPPDAPVRSRSRRLWLSGRQAQPCNLRGHPRVGSPRPGDTNFGMLEACRDERCPRATWNAEHGRRKASVLSLSDASPATYAMLPRSPNQ